MSDEPKPPYVQFEYRSVEDREASEKEGHFVGKDVIFVLVTPAGTRDRIEREVDDWLNSLDEGIKQERIPAFWGQAYRKALEDFKESRETPEFGTPIKDWPSVSASQVKLLLDINVRTVEQLAEANEETVQRIGMGGRALKAKAQAWLDSSKDTGKVASELEALREEIKALKTRDDEREKELAKLKKKAPIEEGAE